MYDLILRGGRVVDGRGTEPRTTDVAVSGHRIVAVGDLASDEPAATTLDAAGLVVCPGFVNPLSHSYLSVLEDVGLVTHERAGTKHLYELDSAGVAVLRDWVDGFWSEALARFKAAAEETSRTGGSS